MAPVESHTASALRQRIGGLTDRPHLLIGELQNFANLLTRPNIRSDLGGELSGFVNSLGTLAVTATLADSVPANQLQKWILHSCLSCVQVGTSATQ
jgi:hypothetical protein